MRIPTELRDRIARIAEHRGTSMLDVVTDAVRQIESDEWWANVHAALDEMSPADLADYNSESERLSRTLSDGLND